MENPDLQRVILSFSDGESLAKIYDSVRDPDIRLLIRQHVKERVSLKTKSTLSLRGLSRRKRTCGHELTKPCEFHYQRAIGYDHVEHEKIIEWEMLMLCKGCFTYGMWRFATDKLESEQVCTYITPRLRFEAKQLRMNLIAFDIDAQVEWYLNQDRWVLEKKMPNKYQTVYCHSTCRDYCVPRCPRVGFHVFDRILQNLFVHK